MSLTRIRLGSTDPPLKAWFSVPSHVATVRDLKKSLCSDIDALDDVAPERVTLLLDEFELLDDSPINVLRDGDLLLVQWLDRAKSVKRKAENSDDEPRKKRRQGSRVKPDPSPAPQPGPSRDKSKRPSVHHGPTPGPSRRITKRPTPSVAPSSYPKRTTLSEHEDDDSDSTSSNDSSDSSDSDDGSSSSDSSTTSTSSDSDSDTDSPPSEEDAAESKRNAVPGSSSRGPPVPPGYGKSQTKSRNLRRRKKKQYEREEANQSQPQTAASGVNAIAVAGRDALLAPPRSDVLAAISNRSGEPEKGGGGRGIWTTRLERSEDQSQSRPQTPAERTILMSLGLSNKNKKKGFKAHLNDEVPQKIVFAKPPSPASQRPSSEVEAGDYSEVQAGRSAHVGPSAPRLVPPSEYQDRGELPQNMFVTSVDVEAGMWPDSNKSRKSKGKAKGKGRGKRRDEEEWAEEVGVWLDYGEGVEGEDVARGEVQQTSSATEVANLLSANADTGTDGVGEVVWANVETRFDSLPLLTGEEQLRDGMLFCWKALDINPATLTPEVMLKLARYVRLDSGMDSASLTVRPLIRPTSAAVSFGHVLGHDEEGGGKGVEEVEEVEERVDWDAAVREGWKVVQ
ncbi:hypothetical protein NEOLEDRAFT_1181852 [Neolentinus lepideus HHB14362 ss-1]|uniref:Coilin n=1 Tax=Neolentinus lepideus HHB14362 ss-1 TaxID=1314782 RepID=A0A165PLY9_9AGAM|nr:hypothetical protein NEOLEDRAFT_1181852 [Neolentinus lepideus HHB14362 ss-1]